MSSRIKDLVFKTKNDKAETTTSTARAIMEAEVQQREAKTARLRKLRLQKEADDAVASAAQPQSAGKADSRRRRDKR